MQNLIVKPKSWALTENQYVFQKAQQILYVQRCFCYEKYLLATAHKTSAKVKSSEIARIQISK